jgi:hypothetical protein
VESNQLRIVINDSYVIVCKNGIQNSDFHQATFLRVEREKKKEKIITEPLSFGEFGFPESATKLESITLF